MSAENSVGINDFAIKTQNVVNETIGFADREKFEQWLGKGADFRVKEARFLAQELGDHQRNINNGSNRALVLLMAKMISLTGTWGRGEDHELLMNRLIKDLGGDDKAQQVIEEGFSEENGVWRLTGKPETDLADQVSEVVDEWFKKDSPQAREKKLKEELQVLAAQQNRIQAGAGESEDRADELEVENNRLKDLAVAQTTHIEELGRKLRVAKEQKAQPVLTEGVEGEAAAREKAEAVYEALPPKIQKMIDKVLKQLDPIKKVKDSETEPPENLGETDKALLEQFKVFSGLDLAELAKLEKAGEVLSALPEIMRLKLEERRKAQAGVREKNREKKAVKDYFAEHEIKLIYDQDNSGFGVEKGLSEQLEKAQSLGVNIFEADKELSVSTGQTEVTDLSLILDPQGRLKTTKIKAATLRLEVFNNPKILEEEMISVFGSERKQESESNAYIFARGENGFVVKYNNAIIGKVSFNQTAGEMIINWQTQDGDLAGFSVAKRLNQEWNSGIAGLIDNKLGGFELKVVVEGGAEKTEEVKSEPVAIPAEPIVPVEAAPAPETASAEPVESVVPAPPVAEEAVSTAELPTPSKEAPKSEEEMPDWLRALQEAPFQPAEVSAKAEKPAAQPLLEPEAPKPNTDRQSLDF